MYSTDSKKRTERSDTSILCILVHFRHISVDEVFEPKLRKIAELF